MSPSAADELSRQKINLDGTRKVFMSLAHYMSIGGQTSMPLQPNNPSKVNENQDSTEHTTSPEALFGVCRAFFEDYQQCWKEEQKKIAKAMFSKVEMTRKV